MLVKLHYIFSSSCSSGSSSKGDSEDYTKRRSGFDICPLFSVCTTTRSSEEFGIIFILGCVCVCCLYKKTFLDMTWFDLVFFLFFKCRGYEDGDSLVHGVWLSIV